MPSRKINYSSNRVSNLYRLTVNWSFQYICDHWFCARVLKVFFYLISVEKLLITWIRRKWKTRINIFWISKQVMIFRNMFVDGDLFSALSLSHPGFSFVSNRVKILHFFFHFVNWFVFFQTIVWFKNDRLRIFIS